MFINCRQDVTINRITFDNVIKKFKRFSRCPLDSNEVSHKNKYLCGVWCSNNDTNQEHTFLGVTAYPLMYRCQHICRPCCIHLYLDHTENGHNNLLILWSLSLLFKAVKIASGVQDTDWRSAAGVDQMLPEYRLHQMTHW